MKMKIKVLRLDMKTVIFLFASIVAKTMNGNI